MSDELEVDGPTIDDTDIVDSNPQAGGAAVVSGFPPVDKLFEDVPHKAFEDPAYYKSLMGGGSDTAKRLHAIFQKYATCKDPKDKAVFKQQIGNAYWDFVAGVARGAAGKLTAPQQFLLRFGVLHPNLLTAESKTFLAKLIVHSDLEQPVYYLDEWLRLIGTGQARVSETDEAPTARAGNDNAHLRGLMEKAAGKLEGSKSLLRAKNGERRQLDEKLVEYARALTEHDPLAEFEEVDNCFTESQKTMYTALGDVLKNIARADREMNSYIKDLRQAAEDIESIQSKMGEASNVTETAADIASIDTEFSSIRQMAKMTVGRQGNAFPILSSEYFRGSPNGVGFKENVISKLAWIESIDAEAFIRYYKNKPQRIVPYVFLLPTYGDLGSCWQPFEKSNRATSRGHIAIPMYPKNLTIALLYAVGDYRWQAAKEKASFYWMEEGLTGNYYQWFQAQKLKGDVKAYFIQDYIMWMTKESEGTQKLEKDVRGTFWRYMPFTQPVKEKLKDRNLIYQELYQRDKNRSQSDM